ncbi:hypothetical protein E5A73_03860 [Sphingomonas gei]|uniref:Peptidase S9 prolyl oligopeptidase catalytic domain-containing protein n=1 Tax=Sphingomonas gei TaxID=1395960 RepID=A0A4S1XJ19_9SPHN|nr:prolyl oligopeptidase family serine peptidase [Sphingomonas gei]TGX56231.1 hypothetical protein E5A73_03860 [Sphingomonas gei]
MRRNQDFRATKATVLVLAGVLLLANAGPTPAPTIADRYAHADLYLRRELDKLIANADLRATVAKNLRGKLLPSHGDIDDNVPLTESMRLANALITAARDVDWVILPDTTHRVAQPLFWHKQRDYFTQHLLDEKPPVLPLSAPTAAMPTIGATTK